MSNSSNYCWFFFRNEISPEISDYLIIYIEKWLQKTLLELNSSIPPFDYAFYSKKYMDPVCREQGIWIQKQVGTFQYAGPVIRIFLGQNNLLMVLQFPRAIDFPNISDFLLDDDLISKFHDSLLDLFKKNWDWQKFTQYINLIGIHHCRLNCGGCCDGDDYTRSYLLGGQYCRGLSIVGQLCLYRLFNPPLSPENRVCEEYRCGQLQNPESENSLLLSTSVYCFTPNYDTADMAEFFDQIQRINNNDNPEEILEMTIRAQEIRHYTGIVEVIQNLIKPIGSQLPQFTEAFLFALARNQIENCIELLNQSRKELGEQFKSLQIALEGFRAWYSRYSYRRSHQAHCIYPPLNFESEKE